MKREYGNPKEWQFSEWDPSLSVSFGDNKAHSSRSYDIIFASF